MTDVKIENHDVALDSAGRMVYIDGADALFQRAVISASVGRGSFIYDRTLGCDYTFNPDDEFANRKVALGINEAFARFYKTSAEVQDIGQGVTLKITVNSESRTQEVRLIGDV